MNTFRSKATTVSSCMVLLLGCAIIGGTAMAQGPSYACDAVEAGSIEDMICKDKELSALDRKLSD